MVIWGMVSSEFMQGLVNVPIEHHPSIGDIISNRYLKVMFKIPQKGHLPTPVMTLFDQTEPPPRGEPQSHGALPTEALRKGLRCREAPPVPLFGLMGSI